MDGIGLADAIEMLRTEVFRAQETALGIEAGVSGGLHQETTQTVTLVLGPPVDQQGRPISVADTSDESKG